MQTLLPEAIVEWAAQQRAQGRQPVVLDVRDDWERATASVTAQAAWPKHDGRIGRY